MEQKPNSIEVWQVGWCPTNPETYHVYLHPILFREKQGARTFGRRLKLGYSGPGRAVLVKSVLEVEDL